MFQESPVSISELKFIHFHFFNGTIIYNLSILLLRDMWIFPTFIILHGSITGSFLNMSLVHVQEFL